MGYIGQAPANKVVTSADIEDGVVSAADLGANSVDSSELVDGSIDTSHIGALQVTGAKLNTDVISAQTALGATPADTDELLVSDAGVLKRVDYSYLKGITAANFRPNSKAIIINGDMQVAQRGTSTTGITTTAGYYASDRYQWAVNHGGTVTITQESLSSGDAFADGFSKSLKVDVTTADASLGAAEYAIMRTTLEGQDLQLFKKGSSTAETYTLSFWAKHTKTGTHIVELWDNTNSRNSHASYTISSTNTWEKKVLNFAADTTGAIANSNAGGMIIGFYVAAGSDFTSGTLNTAWAANTNANRAVGQVNNLDSTSNNFEITGIQLEVGTYTSATIPPFQHESYGDNLARCQRYYVKETATRWGGYKRHDANSMFVHKLPVPMRAAPTLDSDDLGHFSNFQSALGSSLSNLTSYDFDIIVGTIIVQVDSNYSSTHVMIPSWESKTVNFSSEL